MEFEQPMTFVRAMKGAPASVLWALVFTRRMMTADELERWTGYADENITKAVRLLVDLGWVIARSARGPWGLADGRQLPLSHESDKIGLAADSSSSSTYPGLLSSYREEEQEERDESDLIGLSEALDSAGIREPKRGVLLKLAHVTPELIAAHVAQGRAEGVNMGTVIYRIQHNWEPQERYKPKTNAVEPGYWNKQFDMKGWR